MAAHLRYAALLLAAGAAGCNLAPCNNECPAGQHCDAALMACVPDGQGQDAGPTGCTSDLQCADPRPRCEALTGRCVQCLGSADCPGGRCELATLTCATGCQRTEDCAATPATPWCASDGACVECRVPGDCAAGSGGVRRTCDRTARKCVDAPCTRSADCSEDPNGHECHVASGRCVQCVDDASCAPGRCHPQQLRCVDCVEDADCHTDAGETCDPANSVCKRTGCGSDADCLAPERCDLATHKCAACVEDADCRFGGTCQTGACRDPSSCDGDTDCVWPRLCEGGACVACRTEAQCRTGQTCSGGACAEPAGCTATEACGTARICVAGHCASVACTPDGFEPNDDAGLARPVSPGSLTASLCPNEQDWFQVAAPAGAGVQATATYDASRPAPRVEIVYNTGSPAVVASGAPNGAGVLDAIVEKLPTGSGPALVRVSATGDAPLTYALTLTVKPGGVCSDDAREPDGNQALAPAVQPGTLEGTLCPSDQDWVAVDVPENQRPVASVTVTGGPSSAALLEIYTLVNGSLKKDATGYSSASAVTIAGAGGQRFWVAVASKASYKTSYSLGISLRPRPPANDLCSSPATLAPNASTAGTTAGSVNNHATAACGAGGDVYYRLALASPSRVALSLSADFDAALAVSADCGPTPLACVDAGAGSERLSFDALPAGTWIVRVDGKTGQEGSFTLQADVQAADATPTGTCAAPTAIPGTPPVSFDATGGLSLGSDALTASCGTAGNDAVWGFSLAQPAHLVATAQAFRGASLSLAEGADCASTSAACTDAGTDGVATLERMALPAGEWRLRLDGGTLARGRFALHVSLTEAVFPPGNDECSGASDLGDSAAGTTRGAGAHYAAPCASAPGSPDAVWRLVVADTDKEVDVALDAAFDAVLAVTQGGCGGGTVLACADGPDARVRLPSLAPGEYWVWVSGFAGGSGAYTISSSQSGASDVPANQTCDTAEDVDLSAGPAARAGSTRRAADTLHPATCTGAPLAGPNVVYRVSVPPGRTLVADLTPSEFDGAVYLLDDCAASACLAGADNSFVAGGVERVRRTNSGAAPATWKVVVDSWQPAAAGHFALALSLE